MIYELHLNALDGQLPPITTLIEALTEAGIACQPQPAGAADGGVDYFSIGDSAHGLEVTVIDGVISFSVPVTYHGQAAREVFDMVWKAARYVQTVIPTPLFDPQLGHPISVDNAFDIEKVLMAYAGLVRHLQSFEL